MLGWGIRPQQARTQLPQESQEIQSVADSSLPPHRMQVSPVTSSGWSFS